MSITLQNKDQMIAYLAAEGKNNAEIAQMTGLKVDTVRLKLTDERMKFEVKSLRYKLYGKDHKKRFQEILPHAIDVTEAILLDPNTKPATKFAAAQEIMDRTLGKPKQTVEHEGSLVRALFEKMDEAKNVSPVIDVPKKHASVTLIDNPVPKKITINPNTTDDPVDEWINKNL